MNQIKIGDLLKEERLKEGYKTLKEFSIKTGVSTATLSRVEKNNQKPTPETLMQISKHLSHVTYGELMKVAGYFEGLNKDQEQFLEELMNKNEQLDIEIHTLIDRILDHSKIDSTLKTTLLSQLTDESLIGLYEQSNADEIKKLYQQCDFQEEDKIDLIDYLKSLLSKFSPKLGEYLDLVKNIKPIPLVGAICAGEGLIASENIEEYINYPFFKKRQPDFALRVSGDSMINAGINDGDIVFFHKSNWAEFNGQIVAVVNGEEGVLKRLKWSEGTPKLTLSPENDLYQSMEVMPNEIIVCGVYAGHFTF